MTMTRTFVGALLASTVIFAPATIWAQNTPPLPPEPVEEIVVTGRNIPNEKRATSEISSVLDAESFRITGDSDIAGALVRVTGVSTDDGGVVIVRGLNERYSQVLVNGVSMPSTDPLQRVVSLDIFPTGLVEGVLVQKTWSPQYPGDFGGGLVELRTLAVPDNEFFAFGISGTYNTETTFQDGYVGESGEADWSGFDFGDRDIPDLLRGGTQGLGEAQLELAGEDLRNAWSILRKEINPDYSMGASYGNSFDVGNSRLGVIAAVDYGNGWKTREGIRRTVANVADGVEAFDDYSPAGCVDAPGLENCGFFNTERDLELNALASVALEIDPSNIVKATTFLLRQTTAEALIQQGFNGDDGAVFQRNLTDWVERQSWSNQLTGEHDVEIGAQSPLLAEWRVAYSEGTRDVKDRKRYLYRYDTALQRFLFDPRSTESNRIEFGGLYDETFEAGADLTIPFEAGNVLADLKLGASYITQDRTSELRRFGFLNAPRFNTDTALRSQIPEVIYGRVNIDPNGFVIEERTDPSDAFQADFENTGYYAQLDAQLTPTVRVAGGVRYEDAEQTSLSFARGTIFCNQLPAFAQPARCATGGTAFDRFDPIDIAISDDYWLPAGTVTWEFMPDHQIRGGFSQTINRPSLREISTSPFIDSDRDVEVEGNPFLVNAEIDNFDIRWEWYLSRDEFLTVGGFYKDIKNPIERSIIIRGNERPRSFINGDTAEVWGAEVEAEFGLPLNEMAPWLGTREFFVKANVTYTDSEVTIGEATALRSSLTDRTRELQGQSDWLGNVQFGFRDEVRGERLTLLFNYVGDRIDAVGTENRPNVIEESPKFLDLIYGREFAWGEGVVEWTFELRNLLDDDAVLTQGGIVIEQYDVGTSISTGISFRF